MPALSLKAKKLCAAAVASGLALTVHAQTLPKPIEQALQEAQVPADAFSVMVISPTGGVTRLAHQADVARLPASTIKVLTTAVALDTLGPTYQWRTHFIAGGSLINGALRGPLYIRGGGDPTLDAKQLQSVLRQLRAKGVRQIAGDIVLDRSRFDPPRPDVGAPPFDEYPDAYYNLIPDALLLNNNMQEITLQSDTNRVHVRSAQSIDRVRINARGLKLINGDCGQWDEDFQTPSVKAEKGGVLSVHLHGSFPRNCEIETETNVLDRNQYWERSFRALWRELGGQWAGRVREGQAPSNGVVLVEHKSQSLADIVKAVNKRSDNGFARLLLLTMGAERATQGTDTRAAGIAAIHAWLDTHNIAREGLVIENGSGLSRAERVSATQFAHILRAAAQSPWYPELLASLPIAGVDGTMQKRLADSPIKQWIRLKTGSLSNATGLVGYVRDTAGRPWIVAGQVNMDKAAAARPVLDALIEWAASDR